jgi:anthranilate synthase component 2/putative glutamine amidotransferase
MLGSPEAAEDVCQEAFTRAWRCIPRGASADHQRAWLHRTASNLAIDELRRRRVRNHVTVDEAVSVGAERDESERLAAHDALGRLSAHDRLVLLLHAHVGLSHREIGELLDVREDAVRKRVARARRRFTVMLQEGAPRQAPVLALLSSGGGYAPAERWLARAGADVRVLRPDAFVRELPIADGVLLAGGPDTPDIHPALYGERPRAIHGSPDRAHDLRLLRALRTAIEQDLPIVGICGGHQLLNIALGGALHQDLGLEAAARTVHDGATHPIRTEPGSLSRRLLGSAAHVFSGHHQGVRRLGRGLRPTAISPDGVLEAVELPGRRFVLGLQWHPEAAESGAAGRRVADALVVHASGPGGSRR